MWFKQVHIRCLFCIEIFILTLSSEIVVKVEGSRFSYLILRSGALSPPRCDYLIGSYFQREETDSNFLIALHDDSFRIAILVRKE